VIWKEERSAERSEERNATCESVKRIAVCTVKSAGRCGSLTKVVTNMCRLNG
jgi:hypothetical protein